MSYTPNTWLEIASILIWWLLLQVFGWLVWPLAFRLFKNLPDRGAAFCKPLGLILVNYALWMLSTLGFLKNTWGNILLVLIGVGVLALWLYRRTEPSEDRRAGRQDEADIWAWMREHWRMLLAVEFVFTLAFALWVAYKMYDPNIAVTEKPMEFAFLNAIVRSDRFPAYDPWMSGYSISYYYFGYIMVATLANLGSVLPSYAFNLGISTLFALTATGAYGVVYNLVHVAAARRGARNVVGTAIYYGVIAAIAIPLMGNLEGVLEFAHAKGIGVTVKEPGNISGPFWEWVDVKNLTRSGQLSKTWYPTDGWWWWRASRVIHDKGLTGNDMEVIDEFPAFSFLLGDMHPHVLAYPFIFVLIALAFNLLLAQDAPPAWSWWLVYLCLGAIGFLNTWDMPFYLFILVAAYGLNRYLHPGLDSPSLIERVVAKLRNQVFAKNLVSENDLSTFWLRQVIYRTIELTVASVLLYLPYWLYARPKAGAGILPNLFNVSRFTHLFLMFGAFFIVLAVLLVVLLIDLWRKGQVTKQTLLKQGLPLWAGTMAFFPLLLGVVAIPVIALPSVRSYIDDVLANEQVRQFLGPQTIGSLLGISLRIRLGFLPPQLQEIKMPAGPWTFLIISLMIAAILFWLVRSLFPRWLKSKSSEIELASLSVLLALLLAFTGLMLIFSVEFVYLRDAFGTRMNTVFKFYFQAWALLGLAVVFGVYHVLEGRHGSPVGKAVFGLICALLLIGGLLYPLGMSIDRSGGFAGPPTLDGLAFVAREQPEDYAAIRWLNENVTGNPVIVEAVRGSFSYEYARISSRTGLPAVMGWTGHEGQWHGLHEEIAEREADVKRLYGGSAADAREVIDKYGVTYVVVGYLERNEFGNGVTKFDRFMDVAFRDGNTVIYKTRGK
ncbi:MAG: hypothetical protein JW934_06850 [Anaerolineae bacterium]|nr:hypothetical protein [Anaerolineae bacterium]